MQGINHNKAFVQNIRTKKSLRTAYAFLVDRPMTCQRLYTLLTPDLGFEDPLADCKSKLRRALGPYCKKMQNRLKSISFVLFYVMTQVIDGFEISTQSKERGPMNIF